MIEWAMVSRCTFFLSNDALPDLSDNKLFNNLFRPFGISETTVSRKFFPGGYSFVSYVWFVTSSFIISETTSINSDFSASERVCGFPIQLSIF